jgi:hypothetical protein
MPNALLELPCLRLQGVTAPVQQLLKGFYSANDPPTSYELWGRWLVPVYLQVCMRCCIRVAGS